MSSHDITEPHTLWGPEAFFRCSSPRPWKTPSDLQTEEIINPRFEMNPKKSKNMKPYEIHRKINLKYGLSLSTLHQLDIFFSEYKWHIWVNLRQVNQNLVLSLQWSCWPEVWSWSLARVLTLCQPLWDGVVQCFPMTFLRPPHRYVCKLQTYVCKTRSQKRKGLIICKKMNKLEVSSIQICWLHMTSYPFPGRAMSRRIPMLSLTCFTWMGVISWELIQLSHDFRCREEIDHTGSCGNCMAMLNILDIEIYRFTINRFRAFALRYQQALRDLQNCSGAQILVVGRWELPWR